jgi:hypothetical protein
VGKRFGVKDGMEHGLGFSMPIYGPVVTNRISHQEFKLLASEVMGHVFDIHHDFGRFFDEIVYPENGSEI